MALQQKTSFIHFRVENVKLSMHFYINNAVGSGSFVLLPIVKNVKLAVYVLQILRILDELVMIYCPFIGGKINYFVINCWRYLRRHEAMAVILVQK